MGIWKPHIHIPSLPEMFLYKEGFMFPLSTYPSTSFYRFLFESHTSTSLPFSKMMFKKFKKVLTTSTYPSASLSLVAMFIAVFFS
jgi:hypothetical protein